MGQDSGGLPHYTAELANKVSRQEEVTLLKPDDTSADDILLDSVNVVNAFEQTSISMENIFDININLRENVKGLLSFRNIKLVNEIDPDIVHDPTDEFPHISAFAYLYKIYQNRPYVVTCHEVKHGGSSGILKIADMAYYLSPDFPKEAAVVHSESQKEMLVDQDRNITSVKVIPHAVYSFFKKLDHKSPSEKENHALFFGSLIPPKGIEYLIEAVPHIIDSIPNFSLTIAGSGSIPDGCDDLIRKYDNIEVRNEFIPNNEVGELFNEAQIVVLPYRKGWQTGHSGSLSTAFAFGKPVVTTSVGDFPRLVEESGAGVAVEPENPEAIADGIVNILRNNQRRKNMAAASQQMADKLSWENIASQHIELYKEIVTNDE
ncbi:glycosyltransferase family 4 protein [Haloarcula argentinensis]|nr:glycosyltransferase family 4 protein [Haloarcula argentinensis]